jgi:1,4-dihydroxy-6-naphthoate synthase
MSTLSLAYSTDLDDAFMFWAITDGRVDPRDYGFDRVTHERADTATLNAWARDGVFDVVAVSIATLPAIAAHYLLLPHGGSVGRGYGPVVVSRTPLTSLDGLRVGTPGEGTTCAVLVALAAPNAIRVSVPSAPMERAFAALADGSVDACALIHEGRLTYAQRGLHLALDLGAWWHARAGLPLPLGGNVIRRALGPDAIERASRLLRDSIAYALSHRDEALSLLLPGRPELTHAQADEYLSLYANADTLAYPPDARTSVHTLLSDAAAHHLLPAATIEFAP